MNNKSRVFGLVLVLLLMATMVFAQEYNIKGVNIEVTSEVNAERFAIANELYGQDITIGELLEKVFPEALESRKRNLPPDVYEKLNSEPMVWEAENDIAPTSEVIGHISYIYSGNPINFNSNTRIVSVNESNVTFTVRDGKTVTLTGVEFIRRFLMNVLPRGFYC